MRHPFGETVVRVRAAATLDPYSGEATALDWNDTTSLNIVGVAVDDSQSSEPLEDGRNAVISDYVLYPPAGSDVLPGDRVIVRGLTCEVVGRPSSPRNPFTGDTPGMVVRANLVEG